MRLRLLTAPVSVALLASALVVLSSGVAAQTTRSIALSGTASPIGASGPVGDGDTTEFAGGPSDASAPAPVAGTVTRSLSNGTGLGPWVNGSGKAKSNPQFAMGFEGLNHYQQRYSNRGN